MGSIELEQALELGLKSWKPLFSVEDDRRLLRIGQVSNLKFARTEIAITVFDQAQAVTLDHHPAEGAAAGELRLHHWMR